MAVTSSPPTATPVESVYIDALFRSCDPQGRGFITGAAAVPVLKGSNLPPSVLGDVWQIADAQNHGYLNRTEVGLLVRLIGWAQKGEKIRKSLLHRVGPLPIIEGLPLAAAARGEFGSGAGLPQLTEAERKKYHGIFNGLNPKDGVLPGPKCQAAFLTSDLPKPTLALVWDLADTRVRGNLDIVDFTIGMYFIRECLKRAPDTSFLPQSAPEWLYMQAASGTSSTPTSPSTPHTPSTPSTPNTPNTPSSSQPRGVRPRARSETVPKRPRETAWAISSAEKREAYAVFAQLDTDNRGYLEGDVAVPYLLESRLEKLVLSHIWDLADIGSTGRLSRDAFAVALHLVKWRQDGKALPKALPEILVPPSMRKPSPSLAPPVPILRSPSPAIPSSMSSSWSSTMQSSTTSSGSAGSVAFPTAPPAAPIFSGVSIDTAYSQGLCVLCQTEESNMAIIACGHVALCQPCSQLIMQADRKCPICRAGIPPGEGRFLKIIRS